MQFEHRYDETDARAYSDMQDLQMLRDEERDLAELILDKPERILRRNPIDHPCCDKPENFRLHASIERDLDTGYFQGNYYCCGGCGSRICEEDYAAIVEWAERQAEIERRRKIVEFAAIARVMAEKIERMPAASVSLPAARKGVA